MLLFQACFREKIPFCPKHLTVTEGYFDTKSAWGGLITDICYKLYVICNFITRSNMFSIVPLVVLKCRIRALQSSVGYILFIGFVVVLSFYLVPPRRLNSFCKTALTCLCKETVFSKDYGKAVKKAINYPGTLYLSVYLSTQFTACTGHLGNTCQY